MYAQAGLSLSWSHIALCWKSHVTAQILIKSYDNMGSLVLCLPFSQPELLGNLGLENKTHKKYILALRENLTVETTEITLTLSLPVTTFVICSSYLLMFLGSLYCKHMDPDQTAP